MDLNELLALLELEEPAGFEYFEDIAFIFEAEEDLPRQTLYELFSETKPSTVSELIGNYFEDVLEAMPDDTDMFLLLENIKRVLMGLLEGEDGADIHAFVDEMIRFRRWYGQDSEVALRDVDTLEESVLPLKEALIQARVDKLDGSEHSFDFSACLDYELDDYIMDLAQVEEDDWDPEDPAYFTEWKQ